jgi:hypothetical protein
LSESQKLLAMFSIHIVESDTGYVHVVSDYAGEGDISLTLGSQILNTLALMQPHAEGRLSISHPINSNTMH